jgi:hypothetical protein
MLFFLVPIVGEDGLELWVLAGVDPLVIYLSHLRFSLMTLA